MSICLSAQAVREHLWADEQDENSPLVKALDAITDEQIEAAIDGAQLQHFWDAFDDAIHTVLDAVLPPEASQEAVEFYDTPGGVITPGEPGGGLLEEQIALRDDVLRSVDAILEDAGIDGRQVGRFGRLKLRILDLVDNTPEGARNPGIGIAAALHTLGLREGSGVRRREAAPEGETP